MIALTILGEKKKNGLCTVYLFIYLKGDRVRVNTKVAMPPETFDEPVGKITGRTKEIKDQNMIIEQLPVLKNRLQITLQATLLLLAQYAF